ncbi:hypothetical protein TNCV_4943111 [Trichonephila clavipes]|nr:hypothetical protein TNCV_4943111 [Trichonephila clavipes]
MGRKISTKLAWELNTGDFASVRSLDQNICTYIPAPKVTFPYDREDERFLSYKLINCFGAKDNRERIFSWQKVMCFPRFTFPVKTCFPQSRKKLWKATERVAQENINAALSGIKGSNSFTKCGISIDGTWQRRGYSSLNGCVKCHIS